MGRRIVALTDDFMIGTRIVATLEAAGYAVRVVASADELRDAVANADAVLLPFAARGFDAPAIIRALRADAATAHLSILAFGPHVDTAGREAAIAAGATRVATNGQFFAHMAYVVEQTVATSGQQSAASENTDVFPDR